jgi:hypothetical protein
MAVGRAVGFLVTAAWVGLFVGGSENSHGEISDHASDQSSFPYTG